MRRIAKRVWLGVVVAYGYSNPRAKNLICLKSLWLVSNPSPSARQGVINLFALFLSHHSNCEKTIH